jgi:phospholipid/cholesterol/gamma-HCH transport system substrate-binding protein
MIRRLTAVLAILVACASAIVLTGADEEKGARTIRIPFDNAFGLTEGGDLRVGGVKAGVTKKFGVSRGPECQSQKTKAQGGRRTCAIVEAKITKPGFNSFRADASCDIRQQSLIGEYFVDCQPGTSKKELRNDVVPIDQTTSTIPADLVLDVMRRPYRERFRLILAELGTGLAGRPKDLANVLRKAHPGLRETSKTLGILEKQTQVIRDFIDNSDAVVAELESRKKEVARWVDSAENISRISASRRGEIAAGFQRLPRFLDELDPTMQKLGVLADEQTPLLRDLERAAPGLNTFFTRLGPFAEASRPAIRSLGASSDKGIRAIRASSDEITALRRLAENAPRLGKPLRQLLQTADDRSRGRPDTRAASTAPPNPDPTSIANSDRTAFTAMESVWNYIYWQTLSINEFDSISHFLRVALVVGSECAPYANAEQAKNKERQEHCNSWLGPYQPGINAPDPTEDGGADSVSGTRAKKGEKQRGAGDPEALPDPGQRDPSQPQVVLPPGLQDVQNDGRRAAGGNAQSAAPAAPAAPSGDSPQPAPDQLLDFLLAP